MISITIPNNNIAERKYILDIIFNEFLELEYKIEVRGKNIEDDWEINLENGNKLIIEDHFFSKYPIDLEYLKLDNIPTKVKFAQNEFTPEKDIPVIYGNNKLETKNQEHKIIIGGIDIFASSFFMLTRWEEYINENRDFHNRFPATESLAYNNDFLDRPIVNEYLEMLKNMLLELDNNLKFKIHDYQLYLTHDVDFVYKWDSLMKFFRHLLGDIILRKSIKEFFLSVSLYFKVKFNKGKDPYDTFDYLMNISEKLGTKSYFFFMSRGKTKYDNNYKLNDLNILSLIKKIKKRNHYIGIHPTYNAYNDLNQFYKEKKELENICNLDITFGREHFLRFEVPKTWQIWEDNNMKWDSTCSYADLEGFRCGVCYEYSVFNILTRKKLNLKEKPLIVMEGSVTSKENISSKIMEARIKKMMTNVKKYNGEFVFLWHNSSFNLSYWNKYSNVYESVLKNEL